MTRIIAIREHSLEIHPISDEDLEAVLEVYRQCEDFLALGPIPTASLQMVLKDIEISRAEGGIFSGISRVDGKMIGILDYVPGNYHGDTQSAYLSLLMLAAPFRKQGLGQAIVEAFEAEVRKDPLVHRILAGVQVNNPQAVRFWQKQGFRIVSGPKIMPDQTTVFDLQKELG
jgi:ribosomal protein S18 acetylase RimI-like enzyme